MQTYHHQNLDEDEIVLPQLGGKGLMENARTRFIKKVYSILAIQLLFTTLMVTLNMTSPSFHQFQKENTWLIILSFIVSIVTLLCLACSPSMSSSAPTNYVLLSLFTLSQSYIVSYICSFYTAESVFLVALTTLGSTTGLTIYAMTTKNDFTEFMHFMMAFFWSFFFISMFLIIGNVFFIQSTILRNIIAVIFACIYSIYLIIDTQLILGNKKNSLNLDNYVMGAMLLYIDIINLFIQLLEIFGNRQ